MLSTNDEVLSRSCVIVIIMKTFEIVESDLQKYIDEVGPNGEGMRMVYHILCQVMQMGQQHRDSWRVILTNGDHEAEVSETYADYLDRKACGYEVWFDPDGNNGEGQILFENPEDDSHESTSEEN